MAGGGCLRSFGRLLVFGSLLILASGAPVATAEVSGWQPSLLDTSSPRATMQSLLDLIDEASAHLLEYQKSPGPSTQAVVFSLADEARRLMDLREVAPAVTREVAADTFIFLWEILARVELPDLQAIPSSDRLHATGEDKAGPDIWRIPNTEISIARVVEGIHAGEYLISAVTVERAGSMYRRMETLPYVNPPAIPHVYRYTQNLTGWLIPAAWSAQLPAWLRIDLGGQVLWKWLALLLMFAVAALTTSLLFFRIRRTEKSPVHVWFRTLVPISLLVFVWVIFYFGTYQINVTGRGTLLLDYLVELLSGSGLVWLIWTLASQTAETIVRSPRIHSQSLDAHLIRLGGRSIGILAVLILLLKIANELGVPIYGLVASAGVGGLAVALAARSSLENFMGALNLFADRPVRIGDLCRFDDVHSDLREPTGRVESIGLRSTKIRRLDRSLLTVPNADFAQRHIINMSSRDRFLMSATLGLRYETGSDQLRYVLARLRELLHSHPKCIHSYDDPIRVRFVGYGDFALNVSIRVYLMASSINEFMAIQEDILLRMKQVVEQSGCAFAFPSQTIYQARDNGLDPEKRMAAEKAVREWGSAQALPFPEFDEAYRKQIAGTLHYPPEGSPDADRG